jgi:hypothetical protein
MSDKAPRQYRETKFKKPRTTSRQAETIIAKFGNADALAEAAGLDRTTVYRWSYAKNRGGTGGFIPTRSQRKVRMAARKLGITLTAQDWQPDDPEELEGNELLE